MVYISPGNLRMKIPTFSIPSGITCPNSTKLCEQFCYAKKAEKLYPNVLPSRKRNYNETHDWKFVKETVKWILDKKPEYFRIHESGDFYSQEYLDEWMFIAILCPNTRFLAYTQMYDLDYSIKPSNFTVYWSVWPDSKGVPVDGLHAYVIDDGTGKVKKYKTKGHICKKGHGNDLTCDQCKYCFEGKGDVQFKIH